MNDKTSQNSHSFQSLGRTVVQLETAAIAALEERINGEFSTACQAMLECKGRVVITGMGKSGHIGGKIAATLASTGTPAFFVHPGEASHGDLGMITSNDVVLALSNSGETTEILTIVPLIKRLGVPLIAMTGNKQSSLATEALVNLDVSVNVEACPHNLAPTSSTTAALVMGDALAVALLDARDFTAEDFARSHPGGALGRRLLIHVADIMHKGGDIPYVSSSATISEALLQITQKSLGMTAIVDDNQKLLGIYTDGDVRRTLDLDINIKTESVTTVMTADCMTVEKNILAAEALNIMDSHKIGALLVTDKNKQLIGAFNMHDMLRAGIV